MILLGYQCEREREFGRAKSISLGRMRMSHRASCLSLPPIKLQTVLQPLRHYL